MKIKLSQGSASSLGLSNWSLATKLQTIYLMLGDYCTANCKFCAQARNSKADRRLLSRVIWPEFELEEICKKLRNSKTTKRLCIQTLKYPKLEQELDCLVREMRKCSDILISACVNPLSRDSLLKLSLAGVNNIGIGLDCASKELFYKLKPGVGNWEEYIEGIKNAVERFGSCTVHVIVGLGENDFEAIKIISTLKELGAETALFSYTPLKGIELKLGWPEVKRYRAIQLARWLITNNIAKPDDFKFEKGKLVRISIEKEVVEREVSSGKPFQTSGCNYCTRPFYNERARGPFYNYPRELSKNDIEKVRTELGGYGILV